MSLLDKASIVIPRGAASKAGSIAAWNPQAQEIVAIGTTQATANLTRIDENGNRVTVAANVLPRDFVNGGYGEFNIWPSRTNLFLNSASLSTQGVTVTAQAYTVSFSGTGTITFSGAYTGSLVGTGANDTDIVSLTFTPSAGTVTCTVTGTVEYANFEAGSFASAWIPSTGATATRNAITIFQAALSDLLGDTEGGMYAELKIFDNSSTKTIAINNGVGNDATNKRVELRLSTQLTFDVVNTGVTSCSIAAGSISNDTYTKVCVRYAVNSFSLHQDGSTLGSDSSGNTFTDGDLTTLKFAASGGVPETFEGAIRNFVVFNYAPTQIQANEITTP